MRLRIMQDRRTHGQMDSGLYIAAQGMLAEQVRQDQLANDLANASTPGYKSDTATQQSFGSLLLQNTATGQSVGSLNTGTRIDAITTNLDPAGLRQTDQPLDFAVAGNGFFAVRTTAGVRYTRDGQFSTSAAGYLVDAQGNQVLGQGGGPIRVGAKGTVSVNALGVFNVPNAHKQGLNLSTGAAAGRGTGVVRQGELEESGVDPVHTMIDMIGSLRAYESSQKAIQSIDETLQKAANSVGSVGGG
jgi:flagellar basal-body rod protein FlgF